MSDPFGFHRDRAAWALRGAQAAALAVVEVDRVVVGPGTDLDDRVVGADAVAVVAGQAVAAGQTATGLEERRRLVQAADDLLERRLPAGDVERRADRLGRVAVVPGVELVEGRELRPRRVHVGLVAQPAVDVAGGRLAVADADRDGALGRDHVAAG